MNYLTCSINEPNTQVNADILVNDQIFKMVEENFKGEYSNESDCSYCVRDWDKLIDWLNDGLKNDGYTFYNNVFQSQINISTRGLYRSK